MTIYKALKDNTLLLIKLKRAGIITVNPLYKLALYEDYLNADGTKQEKYEAVAKKRNINAQYLARIINKLSKNL